jgi:hypothetical protein
MVKSLIKTCYTYITELERGAMVRIHNMYLFCTQRAITHTKLLQIGAN